MALVAPLLLSAKLARQANLFIRCIARSGCNAQAREKAERQQNAHAYKS
jgi:hypothetical protein